MTALATPWYDDSRIPVTQKAEQAIDLFRRIHNCDPAYLRTGLHDATALTADGFADVPILADEAVQRHVFYAVGERP